MPVKILASTPSAFAYPLLIKNLLHSSLQSASDQEITYQGKIRFSYKTFYERLCRLSNALSDLGLEAGQTVAVMDWDSHRYLECYFAVPMIGAILQTVNVRLNAEQILYTINRARADILLVNREFFPQLALIHSRLETVRHFILIDDETLVGNVGNANTVSVAINTTNAPLNFVAEYETLLAKSSPRYDFPDFDENAQATTFFTTGTTGVPKGVCFSHRQLVLHSLGVATMMGASHAQGHLHREDIYMPMTPMFHVHAWGFPYLATLLGMKQVYPGRYLPGTLLQLIRDEKVSFSHCVPSILQMLFNHPGAELFDLSGWKLMIGGSGLSESMAKTALARGIDILTGYGMSETCPVLTISRLTSADKAASLDEQARLLAKTGYALPLVDLKIVSETLETLPNDGKTVGEIVVRAPWLTPAYLDEPAYSEALWAGGYLHTQDIGNIDERGALKITDRIKDVIKTAGEWISSLELENLIAKHEAVQEVAVIGIDDEKWGERPLALVVLKADFVGKINEKTLRNFAVKSIESLNSSGSPDSPSSPTISRHSILLQCQFVEALVKTSVGKINKREMRESYAKANLA